MKFEFLDWAMPGLGVLGGMSCGSMFFGFTGTVYGAIIGAMLLGALWQALKRLQISKKKGVSEK